MESPLTNAEQAILLLVEARGPGKSICPGEAARRLDAKDWRSAMPEVRDAAARLIASGTIKATQRGVEVDLRDARGPVRLSLR